ncbi:hypothetical protein PRA02_004694 [Salmonella enterica]|nr:hypothetical protein [Salmonella enterica]
MKINVIALMVAFTLSGCAVNHAPKAPLTQQSDRELCQGMGYASANGDGSRLLDIKQELITRIKSGRNSITMQDCQIMLEDGALLAQRDYETNQAMLAGMAKSMEQQQQQPRRMETTNCNSNYMGGFNCTTF